LAYFYNGRELSRHLYHSHFKGENKFFAILRGIIFWHFRRKEILLHHERLGDVLRGNCTYVGYIFREEEGENVKCDVKFRNSESMTKKRMKIHIFGERHMENCHFRISY